MGVVLERAGREENSGTALLNLDPLLRPPESGGGLPSEGATPGEHGGTAFELDEAARCFCLILPRRVILSEPYPHGAQWVLNKY